MKQRGYGMDVVLYKKYGSSTYVEPREEEQVAFKDLPNRFSPPSCRSISAGSKGAYRDFDNLYANVPVLQPGPVQRARERADAVAGGREGQGADALSHKPLELAKASAKSDSEEFLVATPKDAGQHPSLQFPEGNQDGSAR